jgi:hypothetical protein
MFNAQGQEVSAKPSRSYAPTIFSEHPQAAGMQSKQFAAAMQRLLIAEKIKIEVVGPPSKQRSRLVLVEAS